MLLTVDVGNTTIVFGIFENDKLSATFRLSSKEMHTQTTLENFLSGELLRKGLFAASFEAAVLGTVVPAVMPNLLGAIRAVLHVPTLLVDEDIFPEVRYEAEGRLGVDRAICCDAADAKYGAPLVVVDLGTATTLDALGERGQYVGGCILAGMQVTADALCQRTALLPAIELTKPDTYLGFDTVGQIQIGLVSGYLGGLRHLIEETVREMACAQPVKVIATGGFASLAARHLDCIDLVDQDLVLDGLRIIYEANRRALP